MHQSSRENMRQCFARYAKLIPTTGAQPTVLEVASANVNGSYRDDVMRFGFDYIAAGTDAQAEPDILLKDPYRIPVGEKTFDIIISGQMLEHCAFFWDSFKEMARIVRDEGFIFLIAPSAGSKQRYPVDYYRFFPDAYQALADHAGILLVDIFHDQRGPWKDLVGVFSHTQYEVVPFADLFLDAACGAVPTTPSAPEAEQRRQGATYLQLLDRLHDGLEPDFYIEIGVRYGDSLRLARGSALGIDPWPKAQNLSPDHEVMATTSDAFFLNHGMEDRPIPKLALIDGLHLFEYALRDFMNLERVMSPGGIIVIDDAAPFHPLQARRKRETRTWTGDVWKLAACLREHRPDLDIQLVKTGPTGVLVVSRLDPRSTVLWRRYNPICRHFIPDSDPPADLLKEDPVSEDRLDELADRFRRQAVASAE